MNGYLVRRIRGVLAQHGLFTLIYRGLLAVLAFPAALVIAVISPIIKIRLISLYSSRIGHFIMNTHLICCALDAADYVEEKNCFHFFYTQNAAICNQYLVKMWSRTIFILPFPQYWSFVDRILISMLGQKYKTTFKKNFESSAGGHDRWGYLKKNKKQFLCFTEEEKEKGKAILSELGVPAGKRYVCLLVRDSQYLKVHLSNTNDWKYHEYRNADINTHIEAIKWLTENGFYVIRMGNRVEMPLNIHNPMVIDYPTHSLQSDFMDIYLPAHCEFFISTSCGHDVLAPLFGKPLITTNSILFDTHSFFPWLMTIPKKLINTKTNQFVSYSEMYSDFSSIFNSPKPVSRDPRLMLFEKWDKKHYRLTENTSDEILYLVKETLFYIQNGFFLNESQYQENQKLFWKCFPVRLSQVDKSHDDVTIKISPYFLEKHKILYAEVANACILE